MSVISRIIRSRKRLTTRNRWVKSSHAPRLHRLVRSFHLTGQAETPPRITGRSRWVHGRGDISGHTSRGEGVISIRGRAMIRLRSTPVTHRTGKCSVESRWHGRSHRVVAKRFKGRCCGGPVRSTEGWRILFGLRRKMCWCCCGGSGQIRVRSGLRWDGSCHRIRRHGSRRRRGRVVSGRIGSRVHVEISVRRRHAITRRRHQLRAIPIQVRRIIRVLHAVGLQVVNWGAEALLLR